MNKYTLHTGRLNVDTSTTMNYDMQTLMSNIAGQHELISREVMGRETYGVIFVSLDEQDNTKLMCHGSMVNLDYEGESFGPENYLWVMIDKIDAAFRARFFTPECTRSLLKTDLVDYESQHISNQMTEEDLMRLERGALTRGIIEGVLGCLIVLAIVAIILVIFL